MTHITPERIDALWKQAFDNTKAGGKTSHRFAALLFAEPASVQEPEIVQRVKRYAGQTMRTARNPNITARECIELANWLAANATHGITKKGQP